MRNAGRWFRRFVKLGGKTVQMFNMNIVFFWSKASCQMVKLCISRVDVSCVFIRWNKMETGTCLYLRWERASLCSSELGGNSNVQVVKGAVAEPSLLLRQRALSSQQNGEAIRCIMCCHSHETVGPAQFHAGPHSSRLHQTHTTAYTPEALVSICWLIASRISTA